MGQRATWRLLLAVLMALVVGGGLFTAQPASAAPVPDVGVNISNMSNTTEPAEGISPDGSRVCAVWTTFDLTPNSVYVRLYNTASGTFSTGSAIQLSTATNTGKAHCAIDGKGNVHAVWQECSGQCQIAYRMLPAGADPSNGWTSKYSVEFDRDGPDIDSLYADPNGRVWLAYRQYPGTFQVRSWANGSWSGPQSISADVNAEKVRIGVDNAGFVSLTWRDGNNGAAYVYRDPNSGSFSNKYILPGSNGAGLSSIAVDKDNGDIHITYSKNFTELHYVKGGRGGTNFSDRILLSATSQTLSPRIAWAANGRLIIAFDNNNKAEIDVVTSEDRGGNWGASYTLANPGGGAEAPWVVADPNGGGYILYAHRSDSSVFLTTIPGAGCNTTFCDVPANYWAYNQIEQFAQRGITTGCDTKLYCPERGVTRAEMAVFLERTFGDKAPPTPTSQRFTDVPSNYWAYAFIEQFAQRGVTTGCGSTPPEYCPDRGVTRAEMAAFIIRARNLPQDNSAQIFADVAPSYPLYGYVQALYRAGITTGCGKNDQGQLLYCPERGVTRAEMAVFIIRAFP